MDPNPDRYGPMTMIAVTLICAAGATWFLASIVALARLALGWLGW